MAFQGEPHQSGRALCTHTDQAFSETLQEQSQQAESLKQTTARAGQSAVGRTRKQKIPEKLVGRQSANRAG